jgi:tetratricopeptide (TPR) repeat protein
MGQHWTVEIEPPKALNGALELSLLQEALARSPQLTDLATQVARRLLIDDRFDEVIAMLEGREDYRSDYLQCSMLVQAYMSRESEPATRRALELARHGLTLAADPGARAHMRADIGKALTRLGEQDAALAELEQAIAENPWDRNAYKRIAAHHLREYQPEAILALADGLIAQGIGHSRLHASRVLALAQAGDHAAARAANGLDQFLQVSHIQAPPGWADIASFNAALAEQLIAHPALRFDRYGTASTATWRIDTPAMREAPLVAVLQQEIARHAEAYVASIESIDHPWTRTRPAAGMLHNWCVLTDGEGLEEWHVHQNGWLSGTYYVAVPDCIREGQDEGGCLAFGIPEVLVGADTAAAYGQRLLRPEPGMLTLFPSHTYHRTFAHGTSDRRICLAFDIWPR